MKKRLLLFALSAAALLMMTGCDIIGSKECVCRQYRNDVLQAETTVDDVHFDCAKLNSSVTIYDDGTPIVRKTVCSDKF